MALKNVKFAADSIIVNGETVELRGLAFADLMAIYLPNKQQLVELWHAYTNNINNIGLELDRRGQLLADIIVEAPRIVAQIIAISADEPEEIETALRLPIPLQLDALEKIAKLTLASEGGLGELQATVQRMVSTTTAEFTRLKI